MLGSVLIPWFPLVPLVTTSAAITASLAILPVTPEYWILSGPRLPFLSLLLAPTGIVIILQVTISEIGVMSWIEVDAMVNHSFWNWSLSLDPDTRWSSFSSVLVHTGSACILLIPLHNFIFVSWIKSWGSRILMPSFPLVSSYISLQGHQPQLMDSIKLFSP